MSETDQSLRWTERNFPALTVLSLVVVSFLWIIFYLATQMNPLVVILFSPLNYIFILILSYGILLVLWYSRIMHTKNRIYAMIARLHEKLENRVFPKNSEELKREDSVVLQATGFLQSGIIILLQSRQLDNDILQLKLLIIVSSILFYSLRAYGYIRDVPSARQSSVTLLLSILFGDCTAALVILKPDPSIILPVFVLVDAFSSLLLILAVTRYNPTHAQMMNELAEDSHAAPE